MRTPANRPTHRGEMDLSSVRDGETAVVDVRDISELGTILSSGRTPTTRPTSAGARWRWPPRPAREWSV